MEKPPEIIENQENKKTPEEISQEVYGAMRGTDKEKTTAWIEEVRESKREGTIETYEQELLTEAEEFVAQEEERLASEDYSFSSEKVEKAAGLHHRLNTAGVLINEEQRKHENFPFNMLVSKIKKLERRLSKLMELDGDCLRIMTDYVRKE